MNNAVILSYGCLASTVLALSIGDATGRGIMALTAVAFACSALVSWSFGHE